MAVSANDWLTIEPRRLLERLILHVEEPKRRDALAVSDSVLSNFRVLRDDAGRAIGRGCVWPILARPELAAHVTAGRLRGWRSAETAGLFLGRASRATRYRAKPLATGESPETLRWASEQARLLAQVGLDIGAASRSASAIRSIGADTGPLPIAIAKKGAVSFDELRGMKGLPSEVILVPAHPYEPG